eukprot:scaffold14417_cov76-Skeletonema_dohrnii-CCMP3373.AAC.2
MAVTIVLSMEGVIDECVDVNFMEGHDRAGRSVQRTGWRAFVFGILTLFHKLLSKIIRDLAP